jgi:hypothetical protein
MSPFNIQQKNQTIEVVAKITDSLVQEYGCRVKYNKHSGRIELIGGDHCRDIVSEVLTDIMAD